MSADDREDKLAGYCLVISTYTIKQHCKRRLLRKRHFEQIDFTGDLTFPLREYPVANVLAVYSISPITGQDDELLESDFYSLIPENDENLPHAISLSPAVMRYINIEVVKVVYIVGYTKGKVPPDLRTACLELAAWNMGRYRGHRVGLVGNVREQGKTGNVECHCQGNG